MLPHRRCLHLGLLLVHIDTQTLFFEFSALDLVDDERHRIRVSHCAIHDHELVKVGVPLLLRASSKMLLL